MHLQCANGRHSLQLTMTSNSAQLMNFNTIMFGIKEWFVESKCIILEPNVDELWRDGDRGAESRSSWDSFNTIAPPSGLILETHTFLNTVDSRTMLFSGICSKWLYILETVGSQTFQVYSTNWNRQKSLRKAIKILLWTTQSTLKKEISH